MQRRSPMRLLRGSALFAAVFALTPVAAQDAQRDFDFEFGTWKTEVRRLAKPLSGSQEWIAYSGTTVVRPLLGGRSNVAELSIEGASGRIDGVSLRLYEPAAKQWSLNFANLRSGVLTAPVVGAFRDGRGEFHGRDELDGRPIRVRFVISEITRDSARFEQAYSADDGRTWETNWIATDTRIR
ncbi:hypothetical protein [Tahibacter caeni]|uniref:hypothetical protein n=1 Tax=Tahibacter caeni TaxID=1453545 RepID=UPI002147B917|nr:hypothetical protein [Tahibacter caeni]